MNNLNKFFFASQNLQFPFLLSFSYHHLLVISFFSLAILSYRPHCLLLSPKLCLLHLHLFFFLHTDYSQSTVYKPTTISPRRDPNVNTNSFTSHSKRTIQMSLKIIPEQTSLLFKLTCHKLDAEIAVAEVKTRFRRELMMKESKVCVAALMAIVTVTALATPTEA